MRATLEVDRERSVSWNGRRILVARDVRDVVDRLPVPCTIDGEVGDLGGAPTLVRILGVHAAKSVPIDELVEMRRFREAASALAARGEAVEKDPALLALRVRTRVGLSDSKAAFADFNRLLAIDAPPNVVRVVISETYRNVGDAFAKRYARWLAEDPTRRLGRRPADLWGSVPVEAWPDEDLLEHLADAPLEDLHALIGRAKEIAPRDPRIAKAERRRVELRAAKEQDQLARFDGDVFADMVAVLGAVEKTFSAAIPARLRRAWASWTFRDADNLREALDTDLARIARTCEMIVPGARGTKIAEMRRIATDLQAERFPKEPRAPAFLPVGRDPEGAWIGLWLVAPPASHDYPVVRIGADGITLLAQSTEEWLDS